MLSNLKCLITACKILNLEYEFTDDNHNVIKVLKDKGMYFVNCATPFNTQSVGSICDDKDFTFQLLNSCINMPFTADYQDPTTSTYAEYIKFGDIDLIVTDISHKFKFPMILKKNRGSGGDNVFLCENINDVQCNLIEIFNSNSKNYDYIALAQEYIKPKVEYRVIVCNKKIQFVYEKNITGATFIGNYSPLHYVNSHAILIRDEVFVKNVQDFVNPIFNLLELNYGGLDLIVDDHNKMWLIEINSRPGFGHYLMHNPLDEVVSMYLNLLKN